MATLHSPATIEFGAVWFPMLGFRPAVWTPPHRHDAVDPDRLVPAPDSDVPMLAKWEAPATGYAWGTVLTAPPIGQAINQQTLAKQVLTPSHDGQPVTTPWWPVEPHEPEWPCCIIIEPDTPLPPVATVPVPASGVLLLVALAGLALLRRKP